VPSACSRSCQQSRRTANTREVAKSKESDLFGACPLSDQSSTKSCVVASPERDAPLLPYRFNRRRGLTSVRRLMLTMRKRDKLTILIEKCLLNQDQSSTLVGPQVVKPQRLFTPHPEP
jgi:hypothetical protein